MQTNDLNRLVGNFDDYKELENLRLSEFSGTKPTDEELKKAAKTINPELLAKVRNDVDRFQVLGKSRRWIKRWIKRKYNITEY